jgi:hypothetical protein
MEYFLNLMYRCFTIKNFAKECQYEPLRELTEEILIRLLSEDSKEINTSADNNNI